MLFLRSIRWQLVASYVLLTLLVVSLVGVLALAQVKRYAEQQEAEYLAANAEMVVRQALPFFHHGANPFVLQNLADTSSFFGNVRVRIFDGRQQVLADSGPRSTTDEIIWAIPPDEHMAAIIISGRHFDTPSEHRESWRPSDVQLPPGTQYGIIRREERGWSTRLSFEVLPAPAGDSVAPEVRSSPETPRSDRTLTVPIGDRRSPLGYVEISKGPNFGAEALSTTRRAFTVAALGAALIAMLVGLVMSHRLTAPLSSLRHATGRMSGGDLSARADIQGKDEIGELASQFNLMAERLETSFAQLAAERDALRRFIADASHELRTPITALKTFNELLEDATAHDPAAREEFIAESRAQIRRLEWITHNLLDLSRFDAGLIKLDLAEHDVSDLLAATASSFKALAQERTITLLVEEPSSPLALVCDSARLELALSNLVDNALKFTPPGGRVTLSAELAGQSLRLHVADTGPGIPPEDQPHIFERFYRGRNVPAGGSGLGLAIVQSIAQLHGGRAWAESGTQAGCRFTLELPLQATAAALPATQAPSTAR